MPLTLPELDDRTYASLVEEAVRMIPTLAPSWTDFNPSDPGITIVELLAYLTEMLLYRLNRVTDANRQSFLRLLNGPDWLPEPGRTTKESLTETIKALQAKSRAVTAVEYVEHALSADSRVSRAFCLPNRNLEAEPPSGPYVAWPGRISVVIIPDAGATAAGVVAAPADLLKIVADRLEELRLLTTRVHVVGPRLVRVGVQATLFLRADAARAFLDLQGGDIATEVRNQAVKALTAFFSFHTGGLDGQGWPFGRDVFVSEVYQILGALPGVDYVTATTGPDSLPRDELIVGDADTWRLRRVSLTAATAGMSPPRGAVYAVSLQPHELVDVQIDPGAINVSIIQSMDRS